MKNGDTWQAACKWQIQRDAEIHTKLWNDKFSEDLCDKCGEASTSGTFFAGISAYKKAILNQEVK